MRGKAKKEALIKLVAIVGPTASGKTALAVRLAKKFKGEIVSADSRQIYRGLEIGSGAPNYKEKRTVPHHLLGIRSPRTTLGAEVFKTLADKQIKKTKTKGRLPFLVGGTGFYIQAVTQNLSFPRVKPNRTLRKKLERLSAAKLYAILQKLSSAKAKNIDKANPRRLLRAIEILEAKQSLPTGQADLPPLQTGPQKYDCLILGLKPGKKTLQKNIQKRFNAWLKQGFLKEVQKLINSRLPEKRFKELGLHYWYAYQYLKAGLGYRDFKTKSVSSIWQYARRQLTWFKKQPVVWIKTPYQAEKLIKHFITTSQVVQSRKDI